MTSLSSFTPSHRGFSALRFGQVPSPPAQNNLYDKLRNEATLVRAQHRTHTEQTLTQKRQAFLAETILTIPFPSEHVETPQMEALTGKKLLSLMQLYSQDNQNSVENIERAWAKLKAVFTRSKNGPPFSNFAFTRTLIPNSFNEEVSNQIATAVSQATKLGFLENIDFNLYCLTPTGLKALEDNPL